jgi:hypothetical protein
MSLKLEEVPFEFEGKTYMLRCNMAVLEEIQDAHGGDLSEALDPDHAIKGATEFLTAMLNDYADEQGWPERYTRKQVTRKLSFGELANGLTAQIMGMVIRSMAVPDKAANAPKPETPDDIPPENSGN